MQGSSSPRSGRHPPSRCNWPKLVTGGPCCLSAPRSLSPSSRFSLAPADCANVVYHNVCPVALRPPLPYHLTCFPQPRSTWNPACLSELAGRRGWRAPGRTPISRETLVESSKREKASDELHWCIFRGQSRAERPLALHDSPKFEISKAGSAVLGPGRQAASYRNWRMRAFLTADFGCRRESLVQGRSRPKPRRQASRQ
jgi:hypothetical protein